MDEIIIGHANRIALGALNLVRFAVEGDAKRIRMELDDLAVEVEAAQEQMKEPGDGRQD
jgi:hypothetical protein